MLRRATSSALFLLMLNVLAAGDGMVSVGGFGAHCGGMAGPETVEMTDMPGMIMDGTGPGTAEKEPSSPRDMGCQLPWAVGCTSVAPCGPTATVTAPLNRTATALRQAAIRVADASAPETPAVAPELPPPRI